MSDAFPSVDPLMHRTCLDSVIKDGPDIEVKATVKLRNTLPTTIAGVMAVTAYFVEHRDRYPCWIGGLIKT